MKRLLIATSVMLTLLSLPVSAGDKKCDRCDYQQADKELNQVWNSFSPYAQNALRPDQQAWLKHRDKSCKKDFKCLTDITRNQTRYLQWIRDCLNGGGGMACFEDEFGV